MYKKFLDYLENLENLYYDSQKIKFKREDMVEKLGQKEGTTVLNLLQTVMLSSVMNKLNINLENQHLNLKK